VTGPIASAPDGSGGTISGDVDLVSGSFRLGSAPPRRRLPRLPVREINRPADEGRRRGAAPPWRLDLAVDAPDRLNVTGLGINSEWSANLGSPAPSPSRGSTAGPT
jgi:translocation and assembly module TamB